MAWCIELPSTCSSITTGVANADSWGSRSSTLRIWRSPPARFQEERLGELRDAPLEQLWRDHLLVGSLTAHSSGRFDGGAFVVLHPEGNEAVVQAVTRYRQCLRDDQTFSVWTLERYLAVVRSNGGAVGDRRRGPLPRAYRLIAHHVGKNAEVLIAL